MCGIAGIFVHSGAGGSVNREELLRIRDAMARRGPDGAGLWISTDQRLGLAHRRLSIIDLSNDGLQPMSTLNGRYHLVFNGEIYNYKELRQQLAADGVQFRSTCDAEVLLQLYARQGPSMLESLRGMYAFAIYDSLGRSLFLGRDPFGIKPLYYREDGGVFRFASQVKALLQSAGADTGPCAAGHAGFLLWGHVPEPYTMYRGIRALPAGSSIMIVDGQGISRITKFFDVATEFIRARTEAVACSAEERREGLRAALRESVRHHLVADVPVGIFLSSGIDSATLLATAIEVGAEDIRTITLGFEEYGGHELDETRLARAVAQYYGSVHETKWISKSDFGASMTDLLSAMDQPSIDGINTFLVSRAAADLGLKVAMSGLGGDELFGGYPSFKDVPRIAAIRFPKRMHLGLGKAFRSVSAPVLKHFTSPKYAGLLEFGGSLSGGYLLRRGLFMPWELPVLLGGDMAKEGWTELQPLLRLQESIEGIGSEFQSVSALELSWYMRNQLLRDADWAGMAHSLEIRVPLVDVEFFRSVARFSAGGAPVSKAELASTMDKPLPEPILKRKKTGFSVPLREWLFSKDDPGKQLRGIRGWALKVQPRPAHKKRYLALLTDAFGGKGGISKFNRDFLRALCSFPGCDEVVAIPRLVPTVPEATPARLRYVLDAAGSKLKFLYQVAKVLLEPRGFDVVICGHLNLLSVARLAGLIKRCPNVLIIHGIDAWQPTSNRLTNYLACRLEKFIAVSDTTGQRFRAWAGVEQTAGAILPNSVDLRMFQPRAKASDLIKKYGLQDKIVLMTVGRLVSEERYKGFDEVIELMPRLLELEPSLVYMIVGEGSDRARLEAKVMALGIASGVLFTGFVPEEQKCDHYNLADAYVMPSRGEGFGIVFLEAMACGVPVIGSKVDGSREALLDGTLGDLVNPDDPEEITRAIMLALRRPKQIPSGLEYFSLDNFESRVHGMMRTW